MFSECFAPEPAGHNFSGRGKWTYSAHFSILYSHGTYYTASVVILQIRLNYFVDIKVWIFHVSFYRAEFKLRCWSTSLYSSFLGFCSLKPDLPCTKLFFHVTAFNCVRRKARYINCYEAQASNPSAAKGRTRCLSVNKSVFWGCKITGSGNRVVSPLIENCSIHI